MLKSGFECERNVILELKKVIVGAIKGLSEVELSVLFGSLIKGTERVDSDLDIFIVCKGDKSELEERLKDRLSVTQNKFGNPVSLIVKNYEELEDLRTRSIYKEIKKGDVILKRDGFEW